MPRTARVRADRVLTGTGKALFAAVLIVTILIIACATISMQRTQRDVADQEVRIETLEWRVDGLVDYCVELNRYFAGADTVLLSRATMDTLDIHSP